MQQIIEKLKKFAQDRDWGQFHTPAELARAINIESSELSELFLWGKQPDKKRVAEEISDVLIFALLLAEKYNFDIKDIINEKIELNGKKYPVNESYGTNKKYNKKTRKHPRS